MRRDNRDLVGKTCVFNTIQTDDEWTMHNGEKCVVLNRVDEDRFDIEKYGTMYEIRLEDGNELDALASELELVEI